MQGVGPFSEPVLIRVDPDFLYFNPERKKTSTAATTTTKKSDDGMNPMTNPEVFSPPELAPRFNLILQVWDFIDIEIIYRVTMVVRD